MGWSPKCICSSAARDQVWTQDVGALAFLSTWIQREEDPEFSKFTAFSVLEVSTYVKPCPPLRQIQAVDLLVRLPHKGGRPA